MSLNSGVSECFFFVIYNYYSKHLYTYNKTESIFNKILAEIKKLNKEAVEYISKFLYKRLISYIVKLARYGHITFSIQKSQNEA